MLLDLGISDRGTTNESGKHILIDYIVKKI
jgi:hypothetical protein